ncbi:MAG: hypothetical protein ACI4MH_07190 [Candidatus Coproplasma sp.]
MAVATPVLERIKTQSAEERSSYATTMSADELHNAKIKENYRRLINPDFYLNEDRGGSAEQAQVQAQPEAVVEPVFMRPQETVRPEQPYLVQNARADAEIFRADSAVNQQVEREVATVNEEEESEDLRPTQTTIQYRTVESDVAHVENRVEAKSHVLGKREKIIIATFVSVVVALFVLVIVNSVIISNLNNELAYIQQGITTARGALASVNSEIAALVNPDNIADFAASHGLILK